MFTKPTRLASVARSLLRRIGGLAQGRAGIESMGHREYVGGLWLEVGKLQFDFMLNAGLRPEHYLLDIACGSLRAGQFFIPYLDPQHYLGIDKEAGLIEAGKTHEIAPPLLALKEPQLVVSDSFEFERFQHSADFAIAQSLFTHLPPSLIGKCMSKLRGHITSGGVFYATYFECAEVRPPPDASHDHLGYPYTRDQMRAFGEDAGWRMEYIGDWRHPRGQIMVKYLPT